MSFDERRKTVKPDPKHFLKTGDGIKKGNYYNRYAKYRENEEPLYGVDPNLKDVDPEYGELYTNNIEGSIKYLDPRSTRGGRRRKMKQTKRRRRKQTKRTR